ncbi:hypothetical protein M5689_024646 [Euphorbia peplus]|nr:hypothetical protein M5689_024646 [Euphorbia peplus]
METLGFHHENHLHASENKMAALGYVAPSPKTTIPHHGRILITRGESSSQAEQGRLLGPVDNECTFILDIHEPFMPMLTSLHAYVSESKCLFQESVSYGYSRVEKSRA